MATVAIANSVDQIVAESHQIGVFSSQVQRNGCDRETSMHELLDRLVVILRFEGERPAQHPDNPDYNRSHNSGGLSELYRSRLHVSDPFLLLISVRFLQPKKRRRKSKAGISKLASQPFKRGDHYRAEIPRFCQIFYFRQPQVVLAVMNNRRATEEQPTLKPAPFLAVSRTRSHLV